jgi:phosphotransferase system IIB component
MSKHIKRKEAEKVGKQVIAALKAGGLITADQADNVQIVVGGHKKKLRTEPRKPGNNKQWKRHCHHPPAKH